MKKIGIVVLLFSLLLSGCAGKTYSFSEINGFDTAEVSSIRINSGHMQSFQESIDIKQVSYLNMSFEETDKDVLRMVESDDTTEEYIAILYLSTNDNRSVECYFTQQGYVYCFSDSLGKSLRSVRPLDRAFFDGCQWFDVSTLDRIYA